MTRNGGTPMATSDIPPPAFSIGRTASTDPLAAAQEACLVRLATLTIAAHAVPRPVQLILTDDGHMRQLNATYRGVEAPTDVLSFDLSGGDDRALAAGGGEVYVSLDRAAAQAAEQRVPLLEELPRLMVHGLLHLAGFGHDTRAALREMESETERLLAAAGLRGRGQADP